MYGGQRRRRKEHCIFFGDVSIEFSIWLKIALQCSMEQNSIDLRQEHVCMCPVDVNLFQEYYKIVIAIVKGLLGKNLVFFLDTAEVML